MAKNAIQVKEDDKIITDYLKKIISKQIKHRGERMFLLQLRVPAQISMKMMLPL